MASVYEFLKNVPLFAELPDSDLEALCRTAEVISLKGGLTLFEEGEQGNKAYIIEQGQLEITKKASGREVLLAVRQPGEVIGELALLEEAPRMASVRARGEVSLITIHKETLDALMVTSPSAARAMLQTVLSRWRATQAQLRQNEQMAQLGTLTAGVAHELNNPAAAVNRGANQIQAAIAPYGEAQIRLSQYEFTSEQQAVLDALTAIAVKQTAEDSTLDSLTRSDREFEIEEWLVETGVDAPWELSPSLVDMGFEVERLQAMRDDFHEALPVVLNHLCATYQVYSLLREIGQGAGRISEIVKALKSYAYLDQAPVQPVNIHEGLNNTLVILRHKLKQGVNVRRDYADDLPIIQAYGSELNQVWTNLIDNSIDALDGNGEIIIRTRQAEQWIVVEIEDNGPGIPQEIQSRIFDAFFTTKPPGKGTGLGLNISYNIVVYKHQGDLKVMSQPGKTCFEVWLPLKVA